MPLDRPGGEAPRPGQEQSNDLSNWELREEIQINLALDGRPSTRDSDARVAALRSLQGTHMCSLGKEDIPCKVSCSL